MHVRFPLQWCELGLKRLFLVSCTEHNRIEISQISDSLFLGNLEMRDDKSLIYENTSQVIFIKLYQMNLLSPNNKECAI